MMSEVPQAVFIKIEEPIEAILYTGKNLAEIEYACAKWGLQSRDCGGRVWVSSEWLYPDWYLTRWGDCWHKDSVSVSAAGLTKEIEQ
jgi:hypothetical protein